MVSFIILAGIYCQFAEINENLINKYHNSTDSNNHLQHQISCFSPTSVASDITLANSLDPNQARRYVGPNWIQTVRHSDGIPEIIFQKS